MKKFWVVHNIPSPYRLHIFNALWKECRRRGLDFHVHFMSDMSRGYEERPLSWRNPKMDFPYTYWKDYGRGQRHINPGLLWHLWREQPDYLLAGSPFDTLTGMLAGRMTNGVACTWCEGNTKTPGKMGFPLGWIKRFALGGYKFVAVPGSDAAMYIDLHQARTHRKMPTPVLLPNLVDESRFCGKTSIPPLKNQTTTLRLQLQTSTQKTAIIPARLLPVKGLLEFISLLTPEMLQGWQINIIGDGPLKDQILQLIKERNLHSPTPTLHSNSSPIHIIPFVAYDEMPRLYAESDLLILPSVYDPNPLSVVEALHSGLAIALSDQAGNVEEAVTEGQNGWKLPVKDQAAFAAKLQTIFATDRETLRMMGCHSKEYNAQYWNTEKTIRSFVETVTGEKAVEVR